MLLWDKLLSEFYGLWFIIFFKSYSVKFLKISTINFRPDCIIFKQRRFLLRLTERHPVLGGTSLVWNYLNNFETIARAQFRVSLTPWNSLPMVKQKRINHKGMNELIKHDCGFGLIHWWLDTLFSAYKESHSLFCQAAYKS